MDRLIVASRSRARLYDLEGCVVWVGSGGDRDGVSGRRELDTSRLLGDVGYGFIAIAEDTATLRRIDTDRERPTGGCRHRAGRAISPVDRSRISTEDTAGHVWHRLDKIIADAVHIHHDTTERVPDRTDDTRGCDGLDCWSRRVDDKFHITGRAVIIDVVRIDTDHPREGRIERSEHERIRSRSLCDMVGAMRITTVTVVVWYAVIIRIDHRIGIDIDTLDREDTRYVLREIESLLLVEWHLKCVGYIEKLRSLCIGSELRREERKLSMRTHDTTVEGRNPRIIKSIRS